MNSLIQSLKSLISFTPISEQDRDDRYLAESVDIHDLERRMRLIDSGRHHLYAVGAYGVLMN